MPRFLKVPAAAVLAGLLVSGCATTSIGGNDAVLSKMLLGQSQTGGSKLEKAIQEASAHPLGSQKNPVRAAMPPGQRAYLARLKCADLKTPKFHRVGNFGFGVFGNIVDGYEVTCPASTPEKTMVFMDMYHAGYVEDQPIEGFGIAGGRLKAEE